MIIDINGFQMYLDQRGDGEPLLLLHGGTGIGADWRWCSPPATPPASASSSPICADTGARPTRRAHSRFARRRRTSSRCSIISASPRVKAIGLSMGAKTLLHMATQQPDRIDAMVLVSATPYFPAPARAAMAQLSTDRFTDADWAAQRLRHVHGDDQIRCSSIRCAR